jgi:hypothetical protein
MTTVGYGDVAAVSPFGRFISIINAIWGAFIISMLVGSISKIFDMNHPQMTAVAEITNSKKAASTIRAAILHYLAKKERQNYIKSAY